MIRNRRQCNNGHVCRNHRCFKTCDRSRDCGSSNLRCVRDLCRLKDGCGGESINCFESGGDYGDGGFDDDEYRDEGNDEYGDGNLDNDEYGDLDNDEYGVGGFGGRNQRPSFRSSKNFTGHNNVTILKNVRVKRQSQNSEYCEDGYVIQHFFKKMTILSLSHFL